MMHVTMWILLTKEANFPFRAGTSGDSWNEAYVKLRVSRREKSKWNWPSSTPKRLEDTHTKLKTTVIRKHIGNFCTSKEIYLYLLKNGVEDDKQTSIILSTTCANKTGIFPWSNAKKGTWGKSSNMQMKLLCENLRTRVSSWLGGNNIR